MSDKRTVLIEAAMRLFASKGFHSTSIQEIAKESGISKGAFYLHFHSKDELLVAIFRFYYGRLWEKVTDVEEKGLPPKESFKKQLEVQFREIVGHRDFIIMQFQEQGLASNPEMARFMWEKKKEIHLWYEKNLLRIYGQEAQAYIVDGSVILEGMLHSYFHIIMLNNLSISAKDLAHFLIQRLDDVFTCLINRHEPPLLTRESIKTLLAKSPNDVPAAREQIESTLERMQQIISTLALPTETRTDLEDALQVLTAELEKTEPKKVVFQGMLAAFSNIEELRLERDKLALLLGV